MRMAFRILALILAYAGIGLGGDTLAAQFGHDWTDGELHRFTHETTHAVHNVNAPDASVVRVLGVHRR